MDVKLENLIEKIKREGVLEAQKTSEQIIKKAHHQAQDIIETARKDADQMRNKAQKDADQFSQSSQAALIQAARDVVLNIRERLIELCDTVFKRQVQETLTPQGVKELIFKVVEKWSYAKGQTIEVLLSEKDAEAVQELIVAGVKEKGAKQIVVRAIPSLEKGFRIGIKGEDVYYDFSDESIVEALQSMVNPMLGALIKREEE